MSEHKRNKELRRENEEWERKGKEHKRQNDIMEAKHAAAEQRLELYNAIFRCRGLRDRVDNAYPWAAEFDAFISRDMVCGHHPLEPPHYHKPPPHCSFFTAFLLQSVLLNNYDNSMAHLAWFEHIFTPRPPDAVAIEAAIKEGIAAAKGKGKVASTDPQETAKASPGPL